jgi:hypothetical protein
MISLLGPESTHQVAGRGTILAFDTRTQPSVEKIKRGDIFRCLGIKYQALGIERAGMGHYVSPKIGILVREIK